jgi:glyoxylase-like metal-dependent hydrolase (beta-lactamase superfamily II)
MTLTAGRVAAALVVTLSVAASGQDPVRTGDLNVRGLSAASFPRVTRLADNVYAYEQIDPTKRTVTVNNLIVVTSAGVLIAESQGTADNVKRLVADVAAITPQPIAFVVVGSEHGDHTGGIAAFPAGVVYLASDAAGYVTGHTLNINGGLLMS